ncbi:MAG: hypothetical protein J7L20_06090 [Thermoplasmata archaeon]|nr:hypothetical protein [Thermoplasmata archaeon]
MDLKKIYESVSDIYSWEEFAREIERRKREFNNLLDDEAIALIILDELGKSTNKPVRISDLKPGGEYTIQCKVTRLDGVVETRGENPRRGIRLEVEDESGKCYLILWEEHMELVGTFIREGTPIKVINGYTRLRDGKLEINVGRWGLVELDTEPKDIEGVILNAIPLESRFNCDGDYVIVMDVEMDLNGEKKKFRLCCKDAEKVKQLKRGKKIVLKGIKEIEGIKFIDDESIDFKTEA